MQNLATGNLGLSLEYQRPERGAHRRAAGADVVLALMAFVFTWMVAIPAGIYSATHPGSPLDYVFTVLNYIGRGDAELHAGAGAHVDGVFAYFGMSDHGAVLAGVRGGAVELRSRRRPAHPRLAPRGRAGRGGHRAADPDHARQPARRAAQALRHDGARQGTAGVAAGRALSGAAGAESAGQHDRLVSAGALLRKPHRGDGDEPAEHRSAAAARADQPGHVPGRRILLIYSLPRRRSAR